MKTLIIVCVIATSVMPCHAGLWEKLFGKPEVTVKTPDLKIKEAADALDPVGIKTLLAKLDKSSAENEQLKADILRLHQALSPFARVGPSIRSKLQPIDKWNYHVFLINNVPAIQKTLNDAHVAPDGVKFLWGIGTFEPHEGALYMWIREGDDLPIEYTIHKIPNSGDADANANDIADKLKEREILPIGWAFRNAYYVFASAEWSKSRTK